MKVKKEMTPEFVSIVAAGAGEAYYPRVFGLTRHGLVFVWIDGVVAGEGGWKRLTGTVEEDQS